jgi:two-component system NtrC family response regulator
MSEEQQRILIVDDEEGIRNQLSLALEDDYLVTVAEDGAGALNAVREIQPQLVLLDISLSPHGGDKEGLELLPQLLEIDRRLKIILVTGHGERENALAAIAAGAYDFYVKPIDLAELKVIIRRGLRLQQLEFENVRLAESLRDRQSFGEIIGDSQSMREVYKIIQTVAPTNYTVLISGESGTGKELVAKAIHRRSECSTQPFVTINCGAIPEALLESELFGHEKGAFTDAVARKVGKFELADQGTLFLDEIGELSLALQVKLLRFLQDQIIERVGGKAQIQVDVRVIAATNRSLVEEVERKAFREDLFYRLSVIAIDLPPLRARDDDVVLIASHLLNTYAAENKRGKLSFQNEAVAALRAYEWPGNIRELENRIKRAVILSSSNRLTAADLGLDQLTGLEPRTLANVRETAEVQHIRAALLRNNWNISRAARDLGTSRTTLYDLLDKYKIDKGK